MAQLSDLRVAILTEHGFEQSELVSPREALEKAGVTVDVISPQETEVKAWDNGEWGIRVKVDKVLDQANPDDYDGLVLPGGVLNPDKLRTNSQAVEFVRRMYVSGKPIAAICHGPQTLINAGVVEGKEMTSYPSVKADLVNAGAKWVDHDVVVDQGLVTSRSPEDLEAFNKKLLEELREGVHKRNALSHV
ncbi:type 1 glutamine amidotransferase domain-containing protein [Pseudochryseolinea flava]|uniref:Protease n=1 Tax=Pseudochryseolinea flava TaxID=2059302 RepID=A0A364XXX3_9BACT|nr:type 1 glutamine amidotransferase domain-containing protein [Pseudochryseolinea flava]RAV99103.1 protease [Pseudochryseolinea flava]